MSRRRSAANVVRSLLARGWGSERLVLRRIRARSNIGCDVRLWVCAQTGSLGSWKSEKSRGNFPGCLAKTERDGEGEGRERKRGEGRGRERGEEREGERVGERESIVISTGKHDN